MKKLKLKSKCYVFTKLICILTYKNDYFLFFFFLVKIAASQQDNLKFKGRLEPMYALRDQKRILEAALKEEQNEKRILKAALKEEQNQKSDYKQECERLRKELESVQGIEISQLKEGNFIH